jgi:hypothetical protein
LNIVATKQEVTPVTTSQMALVLIQTQQQQIIVITILISSNQNYEQSDLGSTTLVKKFTVIVNPGAVSGTMLSVY